MYATLHVTIDGDDHRRIVRAAAGLTDLLPDDSAEGRRLGALVATPGYNAGLHHLWAALDGLLMLHDIVAAQTDPDHWHTVHEGLGGLAVQTDDGRTQFADGMAASRRSQLRDLGDVIEWMIERLHQMQHAADLVTDEHDDQADTVTLLETADRRIELDPDTGTFWLYGPAGRRPTSRTTVAAAHATPAVTAGATIDVDQPGGQRLAEAVHEAADRFGHLAP